MTKNYPATFATPGSWSLLKQIGLRQVSGAAEPESTDSVARRIRNSVRHPNARRHRIPRTTAQDSLRSGFRSCRILRFSGSVIRRPVIIRHPLRDVAEHIVKAPRIRGLQLHILRTVAVAEQLLLVFRRVKPEGLD